MARSRAAFTDGYVDDIIKAPAGAVVDPTKTVSTEVRALLKELRDSAAFLEDVSTEATARANADTALANAISAEATARTNADTTLTNAISAEATARTNADSAEATARANADTTLTNAISAEVTARTNADLLNVKVAADLGNTAAAPQVIGIQNVPVNPGTPVDGAVLTASGGEWSAAPLPYDSYIVSGAVAIGTGSKSTTITPGLTLPAGTRIRVNATGSTNFVTGTVTSYNGTTGALAFDVVVGDFGGSGSLGAGARVRAVFQDIPNSSLGSGKLGGDVTAAGKALLTAADAAAQVALLGLASSPQPFVRSTAGGTATVGYATFAALYAATVANDRLQITTDLTDFDAAGTLTQPAGLNVDMSRCTITCAAGSSQAIRFAGKGSRFKFSKINLNGRSMLVTMGDNSGAPVVVEGDIDGGGGVITFHGTGMIFIGRITNATVKVGSDSGGGILAVVNGAIDPGSATATVFALETGSSSGEVQLFNSQFNGVYGAAITVTNKTPVAGFSTTQIFVFDAAYYTLNALTIGSSFVWTIPAGAKSIYAVGVGAGGSGGSGSRRPAASTGSGGAGGGGAARFAEWLVLDTTVTATLTITVGAGGPSPAGRNTDGAGTAGTAGGSTTINTLLRAVGGGGGGGGTTTGNATAGTAGSGSNLQAGGAGAVGTLAAVGTAAVDTTTGGAAGGGSGAGIDASGTPRAGGTGGRNTTWNALITAPISNAGGAATGAAGGTATAPTSKNYAGGGGGGGGYASATAGAGGGGVYGGGGGGGAGTIGGTSGAGGAGGDGVVVLIVNF